MSACLRSGPRLPDICFSLQTEIVFACSDRFGLEYHRGGSRAGSVQGRIISAVLHGGDFVHTEDKVRTTKVRILRASHKKAMPLRALDMGTPCRLKSRGGDWSGNRSSCKCIFFLHVDGMKYPRLPYNVFPVTRGVPLPYVFVSCFKRLDDAGHRQRTTAISADVGFAGGETRSGSCRG